MTAQSSWFSPLREVARTIEPPARATFPLHGRIVRESLDEHLPNFGPKLRQIGPERDGLILSWRGRPVHYPSLRELLKTPFVSSETTWSFEKSR